MGCPIMGVTAAIDQGEAYRGYMAAKRESHARELAALNQSYLMPESTALALQARHDPYQEYMSSRMTYRSGLSVTRPNDVARVVGAYSLAGFMPERSRLPINTGANRRMVRATFFKNRRNPKCIALGAANG